MFGVFLGNEPRHSRESHQPRIRDRIYEPVGKLWIDPLVLVAPDDERGRVDLAVLFFVQIALMDGAGEREKVIRSVFSDERRQITRNQLHRHVLWIGDAALEHSLEQWRGAHHPAGEAEREARGAALHL